MYQLTPRMQQNLRQYLAKYHDLFDGGRCSGWKLEELIYKSIQSDNTVDHRATWKERGSNDQADIRVRVNRETYPLDIKSGIVKGKCLTLSGPRLKHFDGDIEKITAYLNSRKSEILSVSYRRAVEDKATHFYQIMYVDATYFHDLNPSSWEKIGKRWKQTNRHGVIFLLNPTMGWKTRWKIPEGLLDMSEEFFV